MTYVLELPTLRVLSLNGRHHWAERARRSAAWRDATYWLAREQRLPAATYVELALRYRPRDRRRRDTDNLVPVLKACRDGLVLAGVIPDDTPEHVGGPLPILEPAEPGEPARWRLAVTYPNTEQQGDPVG